MKPLVELRPEGLYCPAGDFFIDPWRPVARAVITHAHSDHARAGSGQLHATRSGLPLLQWRLGDHDFVGHDYGQAFDLGRARVSLHPAGHVLGSAQVRIEALGRVWVVSGDYKRDPDPSCEPFEPVPCDGFLTEATFALPVYRWCPTPEVVGEVLDWWRECRAQGQTAVLLCYSLGKAQRLLAEIHALLRSDDPLADRPIGLHGAMLAPVEIYRQAGVSMPPTAPVTEQGRRGDWAGSLVLAPPSAAGSPWMKRFAPASTAFASGWMKVRGNRRRRGHDRGFVVSDHADWPSLLRTIAETGASEILATHGNTHALVRVLLDQGLQAQELRTEYGAEE